MDTKPPATPLRDCDLPLGFHSDGTPLNPSDLSYEELESLTWDVNSPEFKELALLRIQLCAWDPLNIGGVLLDKQDALSRIEDETALGHALLHVEFRVIKAQQFALLNR